MLLPASISAEEYILPLPLTVDGMPDGEIDVSIKSHGALLARRDRIIETVRNLVQQQTIASLARLPEWVTEPEVESTGLVIEIDPFSLTVALVIPPRIKKEQIISLGSVSPPLLTDILDPADLSWYVNFFASGELNLNSGSSSFSEIVPLSFGLAPSLHYLGIAADSRMTLNNDPSDPFSFTSLTFTKDFPSAGVRLQGGDISYAPMRFQTTEIVSGILLSNALEAGTAAVGSGTSLSRTLFLETPSKVVISINGSRNRTLNLPSGTYRITDFPMVSGINEIALEIVDEQGVQTEERFFAGFDGSLLAERRQRYTYGMGYDRSGIDLTRLPALFGLHRYGISRSLTGGVGLQLSTERLHGSAELLAATAAGTVSLSGAISLTEELGFGGAFYGSYTYSRPSKPRLQLTGTWYSSNYSSSSGSSNPPPSIFRGNITVGSSVARNLGLSGTYDLDYRRTAADFAHTATVRFSGTLFPQLSFSASARHEWGVNDNDWSGTLLITYRPAADSSLSASADLKNASGSLNWYTVPKFLNGFGSLTFNAAGIGLDSPIPSIISAAGTYLGDTAEITLRQSITTLDTLPEATTSFTISSALSYADGLFGLSRPISDAFVIVGPKEAAEGLVLGIRESGSRVASSRNLFGTVVQQNIRSHTLNRINVEIIDLPAGFDPGRSTAAITPGYRQGAALRIGSDAVVYLAGRLLFEDEVPAGLVFGLVSSLDRPEEEPIMIFTDQEGTFFIYGLVAGRYRIDMEKRGWEEMIIEIDPEMNGFFDLGDVYLSIPSGEQYQSSVIVDTYANASLIAIEESAETPFPAAESKPAVFSSQLPFTLSGKIVSARGTPLADARGRLTKRQDPGFRTISIVSDRDGSFLLSGLPPGAYELIIFEPRNAFFDLNLPSDTPEDLRSAAAEFRLINGEKTDPTGEIVESRYSDTSGAPFQQAVDAVSAAGSFRAARDPSAEDRLLVLDPGGRPAAGISGSAAARSETGEGRGAVFFFTTDSTGRAALPAPVSPYYLIRLFTSDFPEFSVDMRLPDPEPPAPAQPAPNPEAARNLTGLVTAASTTRSAEMKRESARSYRVAYLASSRLQIVAPEGTESGGISGSVSGLDARGRQIYSFFFVSARDGVVALPSEDADRLAVRLFVSDFPEFSLRR